MFTRRIFFIFAILFAFLISAGVSVSSTTEIYKLKVVINLSDFIKNHHDIAEINIAVLNGESFNFGSKSLFVEGIFEIMEEESNEKMANLQLKIFSREDLSMLISPSIKTPLGKLATLSQDEHGENGAVVKTVKVLVRAD